MEKLVELKIDKSYKFTIPNQFPILTRKTLRPIAKNLRQGSQSCIVRIQMINFIESREFSENGFCKFFWTSSENFFGFWRFSSAWFSKICSRITDDHCEEKWFFLEKEFLYIYFRTRARLFRILGEMCHKGWRNCIPRVQRVILLEKL